MKTADEEIDDLRTSFPDVKRVEMGGKICALIPRLVITTSKGPVERAALLYPYPDAGYSTRLFVDQLIDVGPVSWQERSLGGNQWWARSWQNVPAELSWLRVLGAHMRAVV